MVDDLLCLHAAAAFFGLYRIDTLVFHSMSLATINMAAPKRNTVVIPFCHIQKIISFS